MKTKQESGLLLNGRELTNSSGGAISEVYPRQTQTPGIYWTKKWELNYKQLFQIRNTWQIMVIVTKNYDLGVESS